MFRRAVVAGLRPVARLVREDRYLRWLRWASRHVPPLCRPLLVVYRAAARFQLSPAEICAVLRALRGARRFLVFGLGRDSRLWQTLGPTDTHFLAHDGEWVEAAGQGIDHVHAVSYRTSIEEGVEADLESEDLGLDLPPEVGERSWDVVLVGGPPGFEAGRPGRLQSIRAAAKLVRPGGTVAVHDLDRDLEQRASKLWLGEATRRVGRLGVFRALWNEGPPFRGDRVATPRVFSPGHRPVMDLERVCPWYRDDHVEITVVNFEEGLRFGPRHDREVLLVRDPWYPSTPVRSVLVDKLRNRPKRGRVLYLSNTEEIHRLRRSVRLDSHFVNLGALVDERTFRPVDVDKCYDAILNSRFSWFEGDQLKRHHLTEQIEALALLDPMHGSESRHYRDHYASRTNCRFINDCRLDASEVAVVLGRANCGLILSAHEGMCRASSEYLLCGLPVVSTPSKGGRDVWYDDENSILVEPDPGAVAAAVASLVREPRDPHRIRARYLERAAVFRERLIVEVLDPVLRRFEADVSGRELLETLPFPWWPERADDPGDPVPPHRCGRSNHPP